jgi:hypothetical protein
MDRTNIFAAHDDHRVTGWFDYEQARAWQDRDHNGNGSLGRGRGTGIVLTASGKWVGQRWTSWQGEEYTHVYITPDEAREWLIANGCDEAVKGHFGELAEEEDRRPGRPEIGDPVGVRLGDLLGAVDAYAAQHGVKRAEAIRQLVSAGLAVATA